MTLARRLPELSDVFLSCCETNLRKPTLRDNLTVLTGFLRASASIDVSPPDNFILQDREHRQMERSRHQQISRACLVLFGDRVSFTWLGD